MADFPTTARPMQLFFVNPAYDFDFDLHPQPSSNTNMLDDNSLYSAAIDQPNDCWKNVATNGKPPATVTHLVDNSMLLRGYTSEEEASSPIDEDSCSLHSDDSDLSDCTFPEALAESCNNVEQQCSRAQAVTIQPAGKPTMVSLPKLVDIPTRRGVVRPPSIQHHRQSRSEHTTSPKQIHSARISQESHHASVNSSAMDSPASTALSSVITEQSVQIKRKSSVSRHVPLLEAARAISPTTSIPTSVPGTPLDPRTSGIIKRENTLSSQRSNSTTSSLKPTIKRMNKLSSNFRLTRIGKEFRDSFAPRDAARASFIEHAESVTVAPQPSHQPLRNASVNKPKMVARAANERAPTIELPPFPDDQDDFASAWPLKFGATSAYPKMMSVSNSVSSVP